MPRIVTPTGHIIMLPDGVMPPQQVNPMALARAQPGPSGVMSMLPGGPAPQPPHASPPPPSQLDSIRSVYPQQSQQIAAAVQPQPAQPDPRAMHMQLAQELSDHLDRAFGKPKLANAAQADSKSVSRSDE